HTYLWFQPAELKKAFDVSLHSGYDAVGFMLDNPPEGLADTRAFDVVIDAFIEAAQDAPSRAALIASLPETISPGTRHRCLSQGVVPLQGQREALEALAYAGGVGEVWRRGLPVEPTTPPAAASSAISLTEDAGKAALAKFGLSTARRRVVAATEAVAAAAQIGYPVVMKAAGGGLEHKSEVGGVILNLRNDVEAQAAAEKLGAISPDILVEEMIGDGVAEVLIGITVDAQFGQVLVLGSGGILTELWQDSVSLLPPWNRERIDTALRMLKVARLLDGFRGKPRGDRGALLDNVLAVAAYAQANVSRLLEIDVNPLIVRPEGCGAVAVDALIRLTARRHDHD
ncbi:MAG: acetate--CoA ligase family protein, partial [Proteobacteria bacterium]|nr:acetate--CoA ligase family protein [Pseudomonadota bacterium]